MTRYLLDTNIASHIIKGDLLQLTQKLAGIPPQDIAISVITEAELLYGLEKRGAPAGLSLRVHAFLKRVTVLPWTRQEAAAYAELRVIRERAGLSLGTMDMLIAAHSRAAGLALVTRDRTFGLLPGFPAVEDWTC
ncbi:type II toxin-antitoxin system VapC family toxin [Pseudoduganella violacea]|uniref:Ribonuclease VapC n=1 Tax=Pseudoduganella violacea TaxID=1715466 RepID=A0A7W5BBM3_9BURK|nr:type II toxin-antitoxin system VapC family toxin [Pseudoduganella violacea]MBB3119340.1 tRNA(fMet)-specific endonuclease VapC [Pseudoduganella violacea]